MEAGIDVVETVVTPVLKSVETVVDVDSIRPLETPMLQFYTPSLQTTIQPTIFTRPVSIGVIVNTCNCPKVTVRNPKICYFVIYILPFLLFKKFLIFCSDRPCKGWFLYPPG